MPKKIITLDTPRYEIWFIPKGHEHWQLYGYSYEDTKDVVAKAKHLHLNWFMSPVRAYEITELEVLPVTQIAVSRLETAKLLYDGE